MIRLAKWDRQDGAALAIIVASAVLCLIVGIGRLPVQMWDEARLAINAIEMSSTGNLLVPTFHGELDLWNPKPPLATWCAALSMHLFGINQMALRLPVLTAALVTTFLVYAFARRASRSPSTGMLAALMLLGTGGYVELHVARTGDVDSLLVLFLTAATFTLSRALEEVDGRGASKWFLLTAAAFACAAMTKGAAALLILPGYALAIVAAGRGRAVLSSPAAWIGAAAVAALFALYSAAAETAHPGFLADMWHFDVAGRFETTAYDYPRPAHFYAKELMRPWQYWTLRGREDVFFSASAFPWSLGALLLLPWLAASPDGRPRRTAIFCLATVAGFVASISAGATKHPWYIAPAFPLIAVACAIEVRIVALALANSGSLKLLGRAAVPAAFVTAFAGIGFVVAKNQQEIASSAVAPDERLPSFLERLPDALIYGRTVAVISDAQTDIPAISGGRLEGRMRDDAPTEFYIYALRARGIDARIVQNMSQALQAQVIVECGLRLVRGDVLVKRGECAAIRSRP